MRPGVWAIPAVVLTLVALLWYAHAPPRTAGDYRERAALTAEALRSQVQTARLWAREVEERNATRVAAAVAFREAEDDAATAASELGGWDPVGDTIGLCADLTALASDVADALAQLRIAAELAAFPLLVLTRAGAA